MSHASPSPSAPWTIERVVRWALEDFAQRGIESPRLEAELLLGDLLCLDRVHLLLEGSRPLTDSELAEYRERIRRRRNGEPSAYILGRREFYGSEFVVDRRVLVPRPDTEMLVEEALSRTAHRHLFGRALDLCTGSGCVALSFAKHRRTWRVTGTDSSAEALDVARVNAQRLGLVWGVGFAEGDLFEAVSPKQRFELITANPPYISRGELEELAREVRDFEPRKALDGGEDGLSYYRRIADGAAQHLVPGGVLCLEVGAGQAEAVEALLAGRSFEERSRRRDYGGHDRVVAGRRPR